MKNKALISGVLGVLFLSLWVGVGSAAYLVENNDVFVWKFTPAEGDYFYLKLKVNSNTSPLDLTATVYDPKTDNSTASPTFDDVGVNYIYNETQMAYLASVYETEGVVRVYGNKTVNCTKFQMDSDNVFYIDNATGVLCEASLNLGDIVYDMKLVSWEDMDLSVFALPDDGMGDGNAEISLPGYPMEVVMVISAVTIMSYLKFAQKRK